MWTDIHGWEGLYEVSEGGEVRNKLTGKIIVGDKNSTGYYRVCLYNKNHFPSKQRFFRHRLVAEHFIPNIHNLPEVNHKDCKLEHNFVDNLEWCTKKENELHSRIYESKKYKPFKVTFKNGDSKIYQAANDFAKEIKVTSRTVLNWLQKKNLGYKNRNIKNIEYV